MSEAPSGTGFPLLDVVGDARARGIAHGEGFRERILETFAFYMDDLFAGGPLDAGTIENCAERIRALTIKYAPTMVDEIEGIAAGSTLAAWKIFVLNARTEILNARVNECTALYFAETGILAQNWDWVEPLEALVVVIRHEHADGHRHVTFCEPGMVAKIGMNSAGIGVCLNILFAAHGLSGLPVHILVGAVLNARNFEQARHVLDHCGLGKASHLLVGDAKGAAVSMEYYGDEYHALDPRQGVLLHTNHCLGLGAAGRTADLANSCARYDLIESRVGETAERDLSAAKSILLSEDGGDDAPMRAYKAQTFLGSHRVGTCASVIMELGERRFHVRRGPGSYATFETVAL